ncbi:MAG: hypothetical protein ABJL54_11675 [Halioglobus sp.]
MRDATRREILELAQSYLIALLAGTLVLMSVVPQVQPFTTLPHFFFAVLMPSIAILYVYLSSASSGAASSRSKIDSQDTFSSVATEPEENVINRPPISDTARASLAVLPMENLSDNEEDNNLVQGFSMEIIRALYGVPDLRVASYQQSMTYGGRDFKDITHDLDVRYVLTGSLQRAGDKVRVVVMLTDAHESTQLWSESYQRDMEDIFHVQTEIADSVAAQVGSEFLNVVTLDVSRELPQNLSAWGLAHKAMVFWVSTYTKDASEETRTILEEAIKRQPDFAMAHAELGFIHSQRVMNVFTDEMDEEADAALREVNKAYELAPRDPTVMERTSLVWFNLGLKNRAIRLLKALLKAAPHDLVAWGYLGCAMAMGGNEEGVEEGKGILARLLAIAPRHPSVPFWNYFSAGAYAQAGDWESAENFAAVAVDIHPGFCIGWFALANARGNLGDLEGARAAADAARESNPQFSCQVFYEYMLGHSSQWENREMQFKGLIAAGLVQERT